MDSQAAVAHSTAPGHEHPAFLRHHFETVAQQRESASFGMWLFLLTEIMFFGGLFMAYVIFRNWFNPAFVAGSHQLSVPLGTANTAILITSGFFMALAVWAAEVGKRTALVWYLILTSIFGIAFLGVKYVEYSEKWRDSHIPGIKFSIAEQALCFMAGANSIFTGDKLLTTPNNDKTDDQLMFELLGLVPKHANLEQPQSKSYHFTSAAETSQPVTGGCGCGNNSCSTESSVRASL